MANDALEPALGGRYVLGFAIAVRPVFLLHFNQTDEDILSTQLQLADTMSLDK
jgi:hypothetical protein